MSERNSNTPNFGKAGRYAKRVQEINHQLIVWNTLIGALIVAGLAYFAWVKLDANIPFNSVTFIMLGLITATVWFIGSRRIEPLKDERNALWLYLEDHSSKCKVS